MLRYLLILLVFVFAVINANSQFVEESFTARDGLQTAIDYAENELNMTTPVLIGVGTTKGEIDVQDYSFKFSYDIDNGESEAWGYIFVEDEGDEDYRIVVVIKIQLISYLADDITDDIKEQLPPFPSARIVSNWKNSDDVAQNIRDDEDYSIYKSDNPDTEPLNVVLHVNKESDEFIIDDTYWILSFGENEEEDYICFAHAVADDVSCFSLNPNSVNISKENLFSIYPNPAKEHISLDLTNLERPNIKNIIITDSQGKKVSEFNNLSSLNFDVSGLAPGVYDLVLFYEKDVTVKKFVILK